MRGIPLRVEIGPKDIEAGKCVICRRDNGEKIEVALDELESKVGELLDQVQADMLAKARKHLESHTYVATNREEFEKQNVFGTGNANTAFAQYFIGDSFLNPLTDTKTGLFLANVTFEPGCRNNWHIHHATKGGGQLLICTAGEGWYQEEGKEAVSLVPGTVITIPAEVKHWHGAKKDSWFSHIAVEVPGENCSNEWCEPVTDEEYNKLA